MAPIVTAICRAFIAAVLGAWGSGLMLRGTMEPEKTKRGIFGVAGFAVICVGFAIFPQKECAELIAKIFKK